MNPKQSSILPSCQKEPVPMIRASSKYQGI